MLVQAMKTWTKKGVAYLLKAFNSVSMRRLNAPSPALIYMGDGPQFGELKALRDSFECSTNIHLAGYRKDAIARLEGADVCVIPSIWQDAFPLSVLETMAIGKPVIATRVGGIPEMIEHERTGLLVSASNQTALASAICQGSSNFPLVWSSKIPQPSPVW